MTAGVFSIAIKSIALALGVGFVYETELSAFMHFDQHLASD